MSEFSEYAAIKLPDIAAEIVIIWIIFEVAFCVNWTAKGINNPKVQYDEPEKKANKPESANTMRS